MATKNSDDTPTHPPISFTQKFAAKIDKPPNSRDAAQYSHIVKAEPQGDKSAIHCAGNS
ncbi:hypothetical protein [Methylomonas sp.]|jgi:hypothetical protein|uniref:hypothetical protein n=1 Tax=Methylomonas sp. TaxID=418 RepID=UPI0025D8496F|nr:hypothetical protein [Methylomonas sp.]